MMGVLGHLGFLFRLRPCPRIKPGWDPVIDGIVTDRYEAILTPYKSCTGPGYICVFFDREITKCIGLAPHRNLYIRYIA